MMGLIDSVLVFNLFIVGVLALPPRKGDPTGKSLAEAGVGLLVLVAAVRYLTFVWG